MGCSWLFLGCFCAVPGCYWLFVFVSGCFCFTRMLSNFGVTQITCLAGSLSKPGVTQIMCLSRMFFKFGVTQITYLAGMLSKPGVTQIMCLPMMVCKFGVTQITCLVGADSINVRGIACFCRGLWSSSAQGMIIDRRSSRARSI